MKEYITLFLANNMQQDEEIQKLKEALNWTSITVEEKNVGDDKFSMKSLQIAYDPTDLRLKRTRNAGRNSVGANGRWTVKEVRDLCRETSKKEVAAILGLSERTFYRRLKEYESQADDSLFI